MTLVRSSQRPFSRRVARCRSLTKDHATCSPGSTTSHPHCTSGATGPRPDGGPSDLRDCPCLRAGHTVKDLSALSARSATVERHNENLRGRYEFVAGPACLPGTVGRLGARCALTLASHDGTGPGNTGTAATGRTGTGGGDGGTVCGDRDHRRDRPARGGAVGTPQQSPRTAPLAG